ncbi:intercellular adhesion molecule 5 [Lampris incognitus]|uniref:intercellular adhesion molecule 5 n=1 Tax=Lampris incognitus TaxID=2546036 RepID=UPI0024B55C23|nr:intercellular adhesion molecule 5 [Lampris incognitus]
MLPPMLYLLILMLRDSEAQQTCDDVSILVDPSELVVEFGQSAEINCSTGKENDVKLLWKSPDGYELQLENYFVTWTVTNISDWNPQPQCIIITSDELRCGKTPSITVYKNPESVLVYDVSYSYQGLEGTQLHLQCDVDNVAPIQNLTVTWYQGNEAIKTDGFSHANKSETPTSESSSLKLNLTRKHNRAQFRCEAQLNLGRHVSAVSSEPFTKSVEYKPAVECPSSFTGEEHNFTLNMIRCQSDANPRASVEWYHRGRRANASVLLSRTDAGEYDFVANNKHGSANTTITIVVEYPSNFPNLFSEVFVDKGGNASLSCEAEGNPAPELRWSYDAEGHENVGNQSILLVTGVTSNTTYYCTATNKLGKKRKQVYVHVETATTASTLTTPAADVMAEPACPLKLEPNTAVVRFGDQVSVKCSTSSTQAVGMGWEARLGGIAFKQNVTSVLWEVEKLEDLTIEPECYATIHGKQCSKKLPVILYKIPDGVFISQSNHTGPMVEGMMYQLRCDIINVAPVRSLSVTWYQGKDVKHTKTFNYATPNFKNMSSSLSISASRSGNGTQYSCKAQLNLGPEGPATPPTVTSLPYTTIVHFEPTLICPDRYDVKENAVHNLPCVTEGNPEPLITWLRDGKEVSLPSHAPEIHEQNTTVAVVRGRNVSLGCSAEGNPSPDLRWKYSPAANIRVTEGGRHKNISITAATSTNAGTYICVAKNELGNVTRPVTLRVATGIITVSVQNRHRKHRRKSNN